ncbi:MAG: DNA mismatch repair protein MutS [Bacilli bacterium]|nr:DNA mismatch repair protein MutS [Bacilli bacterium]
MTRDEVDRNKITPMMKQYLEIKEKNLDNILFFRLGDFYEMFFEDAITASNELELTLTGKSCGLSEKVPMCGVPFHSATIYIEKLIEKGYKVAICEQTEDPKNAKGIVKRDIVQIITSGTRMNSDFLDDGSNNFIGSILDLKYAYVISYADISTGEIYSFIKEKDNDLLINEILERNIREVVINTDFDKMVLDTLKRTYNVTISIYNNKNFENDYSNVYKDINDERIIESVKYLLSYLESTQKRNLTHLQPVQIVIEDSFMKMNINTKRNLELVENIRTKEKKYSLLWLLDKTKTAMGARKLKSYILNPIIDKNKIIERQNVIETLMKEFILKDELREYLSNIYDLERLIGKISFGSANARDLLQLKTSFKVLPNINQILKKINYKEINTFNNLYDLLENSIYEDAPMTLKEGYLIKEGYNKELDELKINRKGNKDFVSKLEQEEKMRTGIKTLKVGYNRVFGYYIEVSKGAIKDIKEEFGYERKQTLSNCERFITPLLKEKEALILGAEEKIINLEYDLFIEIRETIKKYIPLVQELAKTLSEIDVLSSLAVVAEENNYIKPILNEDNIIDIKDARHPVIEKVLENTEFVSNDITMEKDDTIMLITGPNMAGKSTYMRQMAIISVMAQIGSFVPASYANVPIFDKIFTRIGASDDLTKGESTFMVEMMEANAAITTATKNSLILFDELGRGTATYDGMSLAAAIIEYIHDKVKAKTFFSTHYHELTDLEKTHKHLKNVHVSAKEENGSITFLHKVLPGSIDKSYGIHVAKLAHLPEELIKKADEILNKYESQDKKVTSNNVEQISLDLLEPEKSKVEEELEKINPLEMTPIDAMNTLYNLKQMMK